MATLARKPRMADPTEPERKAQWLSVHHRSFDTEPAVVLPLSEGSLIRW